MISKCTSFIITALLLIDPVDAGFHDVWMGRIARPPSDGIASVYWKRQKNNLGEWIYPSRETLCAHRTERNGTLLIVTNLNNGKRLECPVRDRGPYKKGRVLDLSRPAAKILGCVGLCPVSVRRKGYE